jgi:NodT family efflux transporter outer membrane factor (OMF) lipoprotein
MMRGVGDARRAHSLVLIATVLALAGCAVGPDYARPGVVVPDAYKETDGWKVARPQDDVPRGAWWEIFEDPQLSELEARVSVSNQNLMVAEAQFRQARALVREARAGLFPQVTLGVGVSRSRPSSNVPSSTGAPSGARSNYTLPLDAAWELDVWGRIRRQVESNQAAAQASAADLETARLRLQAELMLDYFQLRTLDAQKQLLVATVAVYQQSLELTQNRYASGVASRADVLQAETQLKSTQAQAIDVGVQRAALEHAIALLVGQPPSTFSLAAAPLTAVPPQIPVGLPSELLERRPDIAAVERRVASANAQVGVATAAYYPTVTLSASAGFQSSSPEKWLVWPSRFWSVGPNVAENVFDGGLRRALTAQARAAYDGSVAAYRQAVLTAFQSVEDNLAALRILEDEARTQDEAVKAAQQSVIVTTNQYKAGIVSYLNVITVQAIALTNETNAVQILGRRMTAAGLLIQALGGGWSVSELPSGRDVTERDSASRVARD